MRLALAVPLSLAALLAAPPARPDIYAVVVGIDAYRNIAPLAGAVNDAVDLAQALGRLGAEVELLTDDAATRAAIIEAFERQSAKAGPGDMFVFTYAGHGMQEPEAIAGDEADGLDETIVLAGFAPNGPAAAERLRDNEIGGLLAAVHPEARVLVVVDSCHSGTMTRAADLRGRRLTTRFAGIGRIGDDPLPKPEAATKGVDLVAADNVVFVAAARDEEQIPEVQIGGATRGAVSWAVARALEGSAGFGGPSMPLGEFRAYVRAQARALSAARQTPSVTFRSGAIGPETSVVPQTALAGAAAPPPTDAAEADRPARLHAIGGAPAGDLAGFGEWIAEAGAADLIWDVGRGELIDAATADLVAEARDVAAIAASLGAWRAARRLAFWPGRPTAELRLEPDDGRHRIGEWIAVSVARPPDAPAYLTVANIASTGAVQFLFPSARDRASGADLVRAGDGWAPIGAAPVVEPVGADHVVALLSAAPETELHRWLETGEGVDAETLVARLKALAAAGGRRVGVTPIFTSR